MTGRVYLVISDFTQGVRAGGRLYIQRTSIISLNLLACLLLNLNETWIVSQATVAKRSYTAKHDEGGEPGSALALNAKYVFGIFCCHLLSCRTVEWRRRLGVQVVVAMLDPHTITSSSTACAFMSAFTPVSKHVIFAPANTPSPS